MVITVASDLAAAFTQIGINIRFAPKQLLPLLHLLPLLAPLMMVQVQFVVSKAKQSASTRTSSQHQVFLVSSLARS